jgi:predicted nucleic-acid-binding Zn-ribbon protein
MRFTQKCSKCTGKRFGVIDEFVQPNADYNRPNAFAPVTFQHARDHMRTLGKFEVWICLACGYTEFYAKELGDVEAVAKQHPDQLRVIDATAPGQGSYR